MDDDRIDKTMIVEITDTDESAEKTELALYNERAEQRRADKLMRPRLPLRAKLIALWNFLFEIIAGVPYICFMSLVGDDWGAWAAILGGLLFAAVHTVAAVISFGHYERKYRMDEWEYELLNVLPLFIISAVTFWVVTNFDVIHDLGTGLIVVILSFCFGVYSMVQCGILCVALGIRHKLERRRS